MLMILGLTHYMLWLSGSQESSVFWHYMYNTRTTHQHIHSLSGG